MMSGHNYLIPQIFSWPARHNVVLKVPAKLIRKRLRTNGDVRWAVRGIRAGKIHFERTDIWTFASTNPPQDLIIEINYKDYDHSSEPGYIELEFLSVHGESGFSTNIPPGLYALYKSPGNPAFRSDGSMKFGSPVIIRSLAVHGQYVEGQPSIWIDKHHDASESMLFINPYPRPILVSLQTHDGRQLPRTRVSGKSARLVDLTTLLTDDENHYVGRLQFSATNRIIAFHIRHGWNDPSQITDHEHCDPYRGDKTHIPLTLWVRDQLARKYQRWRAMRNLKTHTSAEG